MNTTLARETRHPVHHEQATRRVSVLDRAALHVGVALIKWGRRPGAPTHERRVNRVELALLPRPPARSRLSGERGAGDRLHESPRPAAMTRRRVAHFTQSYALHTM
jgi:hypothetical protein